MNEPILVMIVFGGVVGFVFAMGCWAGVSHYQHDTREGTILCEGAESIIYDTATYCLKRKE